jgi:hypothetical protein
VPGGREVGAGAAGAGAAAGGLTGRPLLLLPPPAAAEGPLGAKGGRLLLPPAAGGAAAVEAACWPCCWSCWSRAATSGLTAADADAAAAEGGSIFVAAGLADAAAGGGLLGRGPEAGPAALSSIPSAAGPATRFKQSTGAAAAALRPRMAVRKGADERSSSGTAVQQQTSAEAWGARTKVFQG